MLSIGLWQWYINTTITILHIIHCPVFYLKLSSTLQVCPYLTGNTLRLLYEPNRLMLSIGLWQWYINITITIVDIIHRPAFYLFILFKSNLRSTMFLIRDGVMDNFQNSDSYTTCAFMKSRINWLLCTRLNGVTSQNMGSLIYAALRNPQFAKH
jgi:hypothetical protein